MSVERYNARTAEIHWQQAWDTQKVFAARDEDSRPRYALNLSRRIHWGRLGHVRNCTIGDVVARYKRANGFNVVYPKDAFGIPAKNAASKADLKTCSDVAVTKAQLKSMGLSLDWSRETFACDPTPERGRRANCPAGTGESFEVDPDDIINTYGADAVRWFALSDSPPDREVIWSENAIHGAWRFVQRLWRLINNAAKFSEGAPTVRPAEFSEPAVKVRKTAHRALARVSASIERVRFNVGIAHIHAFASALKAMVADSPAPAGADLKFAAREAAEILVQLFHPMMPHLAEECWLAVGHQRLLATQSWPVLEADLLVEDTITLPVHVNGRKRADVTVAREARNGDIEASALALDTIRRALDGKTPRKVIIVPQRIVNVVA